MPVRSPKILRLRRRELPSDTIELARYLIGKTVVRKGSEAELSGRIVETEAYTTDAASHAAKRTRRSALMFETYGYIYVYFTYGMYYCLNFTTEREGIGAVLIRAIEPLRGLAAMRRRRGMDEIHKLASGPGRLTQALGIDLQFNGKPLGREIKLQARSGIPPISVSQRIGISKATQLNWRFFETGNPFVSPSRLNKSTQL
jgi:DNA-3-methyladenine glycosylase